MFNLLETILPKILMFGEDEGGGEPTATPAEGGDSTIDIAPAGVDVGGDSKPPDWPDTADILKSLNKGKEEPVKPPEEPKKDEPPKDIPPAELKKEFAKPEALLTDLIEGLNVEDFKGKTVKDFAEYVEQLETTAEKNAGMQDIKNVLDKNGVSEEEFQEFLKNREAEQPKELKLDDFDTEEEYREAKLKAEAETANEERLRKVEEQQQADKDVKFRKDLHGTIDEAIKRHSDEVTKRCLLSNEDISSVLDIMGNIPDDVNVDVLGILNKVYDSIAGSKKTYAAESVKTAVAEAKPVHIKEYLDMNLENQKKTLEAMGQTPAPSFVTPPEPPKGSDLEDGSLKKKVIQAIKERMGKT